MDLSFNNITRLHPNLAKYVDDINLTNNWLRLIPSFILAHLKSMTYTRKEVDLTFNPMTCFHGAQTLAHPSQNSKAQSIIAAMKLLRFLYDYDEKLEHCLYRGMKLILLGPTSCGKEEFLHLFMSEEGMDYRQRISEHSYRMRRWLTVADYFLNSYFGTSIGNGKRPSDHRIVHSSTWKFSGSIRNAIIDYCFIKHEQMIVNLVVNFVEYTPDYQYEMLGLWLGR